MVSIWRRIYSTGLAAVVLVLWSWGAVARGADAKSGESHATVSQPPASATSTAVTAPAPAAAPAAMISTMDPLLQLLVTKSVLTSEEANGLSAAPAGEMHDRLVLLLKAKGILSAEDLSALNVRALAIPAAVSAMVPPTTAKAAAAPSAAQYKGPTSGPGDVIPAVEPLRVLQVDPPRRDGIIPAIKIGENISLRPYGSFKASAVYDSTSPYGNDFPLPFFNPITNGPDRLSEFHMTDRALRLGANLEWLDLSPNVVLTGKLELDFAGNFTRSNNSNIGSMRSSSPQIRLGYGRIDWKASDSTTVNFLAGQDWTPFGSSTLPNLFEYTGLGMGFGTLYERDPQFRFGVNHKFGNGVSIEPDLAIVMPAYGNLPADLTVATGPLAGTVIPGNEGINNQLGYGERQGADSGRPEIQARLVAQFQLDHAPGVAPAQIIVSGVNGERDVVLLANQIPAAFAAAFPSGARISSKRHAWTAEVQLPTRYATLIAKYYDGSDLRHFFAGQLYAPFNDTTGLTGTATGQSIDGASTVVFGLRGGVPVIANQLPPRSQGGFVNLGLPLSRWADANPAGRNAGWVLNLHYGYDQVLARDVRRLGGGREKGDMGAITLQYKLNNFVSFFAEQSLYRTRALPLTATGLFPAFAGRPMREVNDRRTEIGPVFTF